MSFSELGQISVLGWNHVITPVQTFLMFLETTKKPHSNGEHQQILYDLGIHIGKGIASLIETERQVKGKELFDEVLKYTTVTGWGRHLLIEGDIDKGKLKIKGISTIAITIEHSDQPVCSFITGCLTGITEIATKKQWKGKETKCKAKGDPYCEFELELK
ncbi:MAG: V4R domain-containing protein [Candidatus Jordarchaeaceae archaeon]